jgi:hypothetical protein
MKKTRLFIIIGFAIVLTAGIAILGNYLINRRAALNLNTMGAIEELLVNIDTDNSMYIGEEFSNITDNLENNVVIDDKQDALDAIDDTLNDISPTVIDETGGFDVDLGDL